MIMLPSSVADFANPEIAALIGKTQQSPKANSRQGEVLQAPWMPWDPSSAPPSAV
jgi:hypothetical protein